MVNELIKDKIQYPKAMYIISHSIHLCVFVFWHNACTLSKMRKISLHLSYTHSFMFFFCTSFLQLICHCVIECNANADCCSNLIVTNKTICICMDKCLICTKPFLSHSKKVKFYVCLGKYHLNCISLSNENISYIQNNEQAWFCSMCITEIFPLNNIEDEVEFAANIEASTLHRNSMCYLSHKVFIPFELNDKDHSSLLCDPDLHYFNSFNQVQANSNYYTETTFKEHVTKCTDAKDMLSMCHLNIISINKNLSSIENYFQTIQYNFTMIGLPETCLNDTNYDLYGLHGYNFVELHRSSLGGGVALCVMKHLDYFERPDLMIMILNQYSLKLAKINYI